METRSQLMNRENAMRILRSKLYQRELDKRMATQQALEASKKKIEWGSQIRSYVFDDRRVKDHRTGVQTSAVCLHQGLPDGIRRRGVAPPRPVPTTGSRTAGIPRRPIRIVSGARFLLPSPLLPCRRLLCPAAPAAGRCGAKLSDDSLPGGAISGGQEARAL